MRDTRYTTIRNDVYQALSRRINALDAMIRLIRIFTTIIV